MRALLIALAASASLCGPARATDVLDDHGGRVIAYALRFEHARKPIRIWGNCGSACTLALAYPDTCAGPRAVIRFHAVHGAGRHNDRLTRWVLGRYPPAVRSWVRARGGLTSRPLTLKGAELRRLIQECK